MPASIDSQCSSFYIPTVDIGPFLRDPESSAANDVVSEIQSACKSTGFFQITGHGISRTVQESTFSAAANFFSLPFDEKKSLDAKSSLGHRGYDVLASQSYEDGILPDLKEGYYVGTDIASSDPRAGRFFMGPNIWPSSQSISPADFKEPCQRYYSQIYELSLRVLQLLAKTLPYGPHVFDEFISNDPATPLRLLHYPPASKTEGKKQFGSSAHTDFGAVTLLLQDENPGLEVLDQGTGTWVPIEPNKEAYVVNVGDMLSLWTGNEYKSSVHRVVNKNPVDRYSIVFFFDGNLDCPLDPLDGSAATKKRTVESHMLERMTQSYGSGKA